MNRRPGRLVLLGHPVAHSLSPLFQQAALDAAAIPLVYEALDVPPDELSTTLQQLRHDRAAGNVTIPHKPAVAATCARLTNVAERTGAVNTFWHEDKLLCGDNTDVAGFHRLVASLELPSFPRHIVLLGAGGAAAAVCEVATTWDGAVVYVINRSTEPARRLADRYPGVVTAAYDLSAALRGADLVVNATPVGLRDDALPVPPRDLPRDAAVTDLVYRRGETQWVRQARARGHRATDGLVMLLEQGAASFKRWFGTEPDRDAMWHALREAAR